MTIPLPETNLIPDDVLQAAIHANGSVTAVACAILTERERCAALVDKHIAGAERSKDAPLYKNGVPMGILIQDLRELRNEIGDGADVVAAERERCREIAESYATSPNHSEAENAIAGRIADKIAGTP